MKKLSFLVIFLALLAACAKRIKKNSQEYTILRSREVKKMDKWIADYKEEVDLIKNYQDGNISYEALLGALKNIVEKKYPQDPKPFTIYKKQLSNDIYRMASLSESTKLTSLDVAKEYAWYAEHLLEVQKKLLFIPQTTFELR